MLETPIILDHSHHSQFDNRRIPMYYSSQPNSAYDEGPPESLRKTTLASFLHNVPPSKRLTNLETVVDATCDFGSVKGDYYANTEGYGSNLNTQFMRSLPSDYYPMETAFSVPSSHPSQVAPLTFTKVDDEQGEISSGRGREYEYASPNSDAPTGLPPPPMLQLCTEPSYTQLEENFGKVVLPKHGGTPQHHPPSSAPPTNNVNSNNGKVVATRCQSGNSGSAAIIYPWMKRVHSKGSANILKCLIQHWLPKPCYIMPLTKTLMV